MHNQNLLNPFLHSWLQHTHTLHYILHNTKQRSGGKGYSRNSYIIIMQFLEDLDRHRGLGYLAFNGKTEGKMGNGRQRMSYTEDLNRWMRGKDEDNIRLYRAPEQTKRIKPGPPTRFQLASYLKTTRLRRTTHIFKNAEYIKTCIYNVLMYTCNNILVMHVRVLRVHFGKHFTRSTRSYFAIDRSLPINVLSTPGLNSLSCKKCVFFQR